MNNSFPKSLRTANPAEGHKLASQLAALATGEQQQTSMQAHLSTQPCTHTAEVLAALYFQTIALANDAWRTLPAEQVQDNSSTFHHVAH